MRVSKVEGEGKEYLFQRQRAELKPPWLRAFHTFQIRMDDPIIPLKSAIQEMDMTWEI